MRAFAVGLLIVLAACSSRKPSLPAGAPPAPAAARTLMMLPDNPCEILTAQEVSVAAGITILSARRVPDIGEIVRAQRENRPPRAGTICNYDSNAAVGDVVIAIPNRSAQNVAAFRRERDDYRRSFQAEDIQGVGYEAWLAGGTTLHVLAGSNVQFIVATRNSQESSRGVAIAVAKSVMSRITR